jgi:hypothetical protein
MAEYAHGQPGSVKWVTSITAWMVAAGRSPRPDGRGARRGRVDAPLTALTLVTAAERPDLVDRMAEVGSEPWPEFLDHDAHVNEHWPCLYELAPDYQFALVEAGSAVAAMGNCIPIRWDRDPHTLPDGGIDAVLEDGAACLREGATPTAVSALMIVVSSERSGKASAPRRSGP